MRAQAGVPGEDDTPNPTPVAGRAALAPPKIDPNTGRRSAPERLDEGATKLNRKLMNFHETFAPAFKAWLETEPTAEGRDMMYGALNLIAEELLRFRDQLTTVSQQAELTNATPGRRANEGAVRRDRRPDHS